MGDYVIPGLEDASRMPAVFAELARRGWPDERLRKLSRGNFLRVWRAVERAAGGNGAAGERRER
jgi:membrane dipeptidase